MNDLSLPGFAPWNFGQNASPSEIPDMWVEASVKVVGARIEAPQRLQFHREMPIREVEGWLSMPGHIADAHLPKLVSFGAVPVVIAKAYAGSLNNAEIDTAKFLAAIKKFELPSGRLWTAVYTRHDPENANLLYMRMFNHEREFECVHNVVGAVGAHWAQLDPQRGWEGKREIMIACGRNRSSVMKVEVGKSNGYVDDVWVDGPFRPERKISANTYTC